MWGPRQQHGRRSSVARNGHAKKTSTPTIDDHEPAFHESNTVSFRIANVQVVHFSKHQSLSSNRPKTITSHGFGDAGFLWPFSPLRPYTRAKGPRVGGNRENAQRSARTWIATYAMRTSAMFIVLALAIIAAPQLAHGACMTDSSVEAFFEGLVSHPRSRRPRSRTEAFRFTAIARSRRRGVVSDYASRTANCSRCSWNLNFRFPSLSRRTTSSGGCSFAHF